MFRIQLCQTFHTTLLNIQDISFWLTKIEFKSLIPLFRKQEITGFSLALIRNVTDLIGYGLDLKSIEPAMSDGNIEELLELIDELRTNDISDDTLNPVSYEYVCVSVRVSVCVSVINYIINDISEYFDTTQRSVH